MPSSWTQDGVWQTNASALMITDHLKGDHVIKVYLIYIVYLIRFFWRTQMSELIDQPVDKPINLSYYSLKLTLNAI